MPYDLNYDPNNEPSSGSYSWHPAYQQIAGAYQQYLGRAGSYGEIMSHLGNGNAMGPSNVQWAIQQIQSSPEASAYRTRQNTPPTAPPPETPPAGGGDKKQTVPPTATGTPVRLDGKIPQPEAVPTAAPAPTGQAPQFQAAQIPLEQQQRLLAGQAGLLESLQQNPYSMSEQGVNQLKEKQKEEALSMQQQQLGQVGINNAARGTFGGGAQAGMENQINQQAIQNILSGNRAVDVQKMMQDRQDVLNVLGMGNQQQGTNLQSALGSGGLGLNYAQLGEQGRQFDLSQQLGWQQLLGQLGLGGAGIGLGYAQLGFANQKALLDWLTGQR